MKLALLPLCLLALLGCPKTKPVIPVSTTAEVYSLSSLGKDEVESYHAIVETLPSPCGTPETLQASIDAKRCGQAIFYSRVAFRTLREKNATSEELSDALERWIARSVQSASMTFAIDVSSAPMLGKASAPVEVIEFADFQCPMCGYFYKEIKQLKPNLEATTAFYFKNFPLSQHLNAEPAARAALAAHKQNKFWEYFDLIFLNQDKIDTEQFGDWAKSLDLDADRFAADYSSVALSRQVAKDREDGLSAGVDSTPSLFINKRRYYGPFNAPSVWDAILIALAESGATTMPEAPK